MKLQLSDDRRNQYQLADATTQRAKLSSRVRPLAELLRSRLNLPTGCSSAESSFLPVESIFVEAVLVETSATF